MDFFGKFWEQFGNILGHFWDIFGTFLGTFWEVFGNIFGTIWEDFLGKNETFFLQLKNISGPIYFLTDIFFNLLHPVDFSKFSSRGRCG